jgi:hypothetical protein
MVRSVLSATGVYHSGTTNYGDGMFVSHSLPYLPSKLASARLSRRHGTCCLMKINLQLHICLDLLQPPTPHDIWSADTAEMTCNTPNRPNGTYDEDITTDNNRPLRDSSALVSTDHATPASEAQAARAVFGTVSLMLTSIYPMRVLQPLTRHTARATRADIEALVEPCSDSRTQMESTGNPRLSRASPQNINA